MKLVLANKSYQRHITDEGEQLQAGLAAAGWRLAGFGYDDDCVDVPTLIERHRPSIVFVQDVREWHRDSAGCYDRRVSFTNWQCLHNFSNVTKATVVKDAASLIEYQQTFFQQIDASIAVTYYHDNAVLAEDCCNWLKPYRRARTYHSIDADFVRTLDLSQERRRCIVTGCAGTIYPLRQLAFANAESLDIDIQWHPGYGANGCHTQDYLRRLSGYKTHVACSSRFSFALRKIVESVAVGCVPITDLPAHDALPEIDDYLVRVPRTIGREGLAEVIAATEAAWDEERAMHFAGKCWEFYDWRLAGQRLSRAMEAAA